MDGEALIQDFKGLARLTQGEQNLGLRCIGKRKPPIEPDGLVKVRERGAQFLLF